MDERRRRVLGLFGTIGIMGVAGCGTLAGDGADKDNSPDDDGDTTNTVSRTISPTTKLTASTTATTTLMDSVSLSEQMSKFELPDGAQNGEFGRAVALSADGSTALISDTRADISESEDAGMAYIYSLIDGEWSLQAKLAPDSGDLFGEAVAVSDDGSTALVGSFRNGDLKGSAYVFERSDGDWSQQVKLTADDGDSEDQFGMSVSLANDGSVAVIGAKLDEDPHGSWGGSAYVFSQVGGEWSQQAKLASEDGDNNEFFGHSVAMSSDGTTALIGANRERHPNGKFSGSVYVFDSTGESWSQQAKLLPDDGDEQDEFGWSVALSDDGTTALIGAYFDEDPNGQYAGSAYVFDGTGGAWSQQAKLFQDDGSENAQFGRSIGLSASGSAAIIGAPRHDEPNESGSGATYVFSRRGGEWSQQAKLVANDVDSSDDFGWSVDLSGDASTALVGARGEEWSESEGWGTAYIFS